MSGKSINELSERQKQCLRLYYTNLEVKEIAAALGLSPHTVTEHLRDARRLLGVSRSMQAARILVGAEGHIRSVPEPNGIEPSDELADTNQATVPYRPAVRNRYNLGILQRIGLIIAIAFIAVALAGALLVGADAITRIFIGHEIDISDPPYRQ